MSYILDALKKIEHEKIKKSSPGAAPSISGGLFKERRPPSGRFGGRKIVVILLLVVLASLATFGITWFVLKPKNNVPVASGPTAAPAVTSPVVPLPVPVSVQPQSQPQVWPQPVVPPVAKQLATPVEVVPPEEEPGRKITVRKKNSAASVAAPQLAAPAKQPLQPQSAGQAVPAPADIKVSGIAWQDEHSARRAVVNGFLLKEGSVVAGAKITAIMTDRVRFSSPAGVFELRLEASSPVDQKR